MEKLQVSGEWHVDMLRKNRQRILQELRNKKDEGEIIFGAGTGIALAVKCCERANVDLIALYHFGRLNMVGRGALSGLLAYGDSNELIQQVGQDVLPLVKKTPVLAGVCGTDPFRVMDIFIEKLKEQGWSGIQNFPTVGIIDGKFRVNLEETGMGYDMEVEMIRKAHELDMLTCPFVFDSEQAAAMTEAGADILVAHMGIEPKRITDFEDTASLDICCDRIKAIAEAGRKENPNVMILCHGGPIAEPDEAAYVIRNLPEIDGFFGTNSIERLTTEAGMTAEAEAFRAIKRIDTEEG